MAYTPKTWQCGEPIMADDLNHMEQGIAQGGAVAPLIVHQLQMTAEEIAEAGITGTEGSDVYRLDATSDAIEAAYASGRAVHLVGNGRIISLVAMNTSSNRRYFGFVASVDRSGTVSGIAWEETPTGYAYPIRMVRQPSES